MSPSEASNLLRRDKATPTSGGPTERRKRTRAIKKSPGKARRYPQPEEINKVNPRRTPLHELILQALTLRHYKSRRPQAPFSRYHLPRPAIFSPGTPPAACRHTATRQQKPVLLPEKRRARRAPHIAAPAFCRVAWRRAQFPVRTQPSSSADAAETGENTHHGASTAPPSLRSPTISVVSAAPQRNGVEKEQPTNHALATLPRRNLFDAWAASTLARLRDANPGIELDSLELHDLVDLLTPDLPAHCVRYDLSRHSPNWKLITASFLDAKRATFMYRLARGCLPITFRPFTKIPTRGKCPFCGSREDLVHIFSQCALPAALHQRVASLYGHPGVPFDTVRFLHPLPAQAVNQYVLLLVECSYQVWVARCAAVFDGRRPGLHEVLAKVRKEIWFVLHRERQRLGVKKFLETWHRPAVIFSESGGKITITF
ncbi:hypothetical protein HPB52_020460 [Rhipicephalus sanguineus]|uniref:Reverse transcriptase zinc-binding domain-containing protein n=1 Tax=Rhipicephalus sanguineus TaxID=34632 RepID=A0A9D4PPK4_RHISA|nr:hypothetical protein HPB52_020460 [Rhipicephalus sanguineus]